MDTASTQETADRPGRRKQSVVAPTVVSTAISTAAATLVAFLGSRDSALKSEIMREARDEFVSKVASAAEDAALSRDLLEIRRSIAEIREAIRGIPRIEAKLEVLEDKVRGK